MLTFLDPLRDLNFLSVAVRLLLASVCGGAIGIERSLKRRAAGFRTHILICLGAAMTTLTSQYLYLSLHMYTDIARLGAQVVAGIGFIGAGTIIVTRHRRVKGLTTAAGLWTSAIIGLCCGAGYYEGAVLATAFILLAELLFSRLEFRIMNNARLVSLRLEYEDADALGRAIEYFRDCDLKIDQMEIGKEGDMPPANLILEVHRKASLQDVIQDLLQINGILGVRTS